MTVPFSSAVGALPRVLVLSSCTGEKRVHPAAQLTLQDVWQGQAHVHRRKQDVRDDLCPAKELYTGAQHRHVMDGVETLRRALPTLSLDLWILSAGYGLVHENAQLAPYEATFQGMGRPEIRRLAHHLNIPASVKEALAQADLVFVLLGKDYLRALNLPLTTRPDQTLIFLGGQSAQQAIGELEARTALLPLANADAQAFSCGLIGLKGFLFQRLAQAAALDPSLLPQWHREPEVALALLNESRSRGGAA